MGNALLACSGHPHECLQQLTAIAAAAPRPRIGSRSHFCLFQAGRIVQVGLCRSDLRRVELQVGPRRASDGRRRVDRVDVAWTRADRIAVAGTYSHVCAARGAVARGGWASTLPPTALHGYLERYPLPLPYSRGVRTGQGRARRRISHLRPDQIPYTHESKLRVMSHAVMFSSDDEGR